MFHPISKHQAPVVQTADNFIHRISHYPTALICARISLFPLVQANMHTTITVKFGSVQKPWTTFNVKYILDHVHCLSTLISTEAHVPSPWYGQYRTHAHNHNTRALAAMDSYFALNGAHQHGIAVGSRSGGKPSYRRPFTAEESALHCFKRRLHRSQVVAVGWEPQNSSPTAMRMEMESLTDLCAQNKL